MTDNQTIKKSNIKKNLDEYYPLLAVLVAFLLVSLSAGPYENGDTSWELDSVSGVLRSGLPFANGSYLIDQPPLGFYMQAAFAQAAGLSIANGTFLVTLFGLGCVALVYGIGKFFYNKTTGFFAALLFALSPWHMVISRSFLIDVPCLFFSLLSVFVGLIAVRKGSLKFFFLSGIVFTAAFNTKLYAVFVLIPLLALLLYYRPKRIRVRLLWIAVFFVPVIISSYLWYETIIGIGVISVFRHADFFIQNPCPTPPTYFFATNFLINYGLGWLFIDATIFSLFVGLVQRKPLWSFRFFDAVCVAVIVCVIGVNTWLGATLDLNAPFRNAFKYEYQALPFFCFLAASLVSKSLFMLDQSKMKKTLMKSGLIAGGLFGFILVATTLFYNMRYTQFFSMWDYLLFRVDPSANAGYSLFNTSPIVQSSPLMFFQFAGFAVAISGLVWVGRHKIVAIATYLHRRRL